MNARRVALAAVTVVLWSADELAQLHMPFALVLLIAVVVDFIMGLVHVLAGGGKLAYTLLPKSAYKLLGYFAVLACVQLAGAHEPGALLVLKPTYAFFTAIEALSILGHAAAVGVPLPPQLRDWFEAITKRAVVPPELESTREVKPNG